MLREKLQFEFDRNTPPKTIDDARRWLLGNEGTITIRARFVTLNRYDEVFVVQLQAPELNEGLIFESTISEMHAIEKLHQFYWEHISNKEVDDQRQNEIPESENLAVAGLSFMLTYKQGVYLKRGEQGYDAGFHTRDGRHFEMTAATPVEALTALRKMVESNPPAPDDEEKVKEFEYRRLRETTEARQHYSRRVELENARYKLAQLQASEKIISAENKKLSDKVMKFRTMSLQIVQSIESFGHFVVLNDEVKDLVYPKE